MLRWFVNDDSALWTTLRFGERPDRLVQLGNRTDVDDVIQNSGI